MPGRVGTAAHRLGNARRASAPHHLQPEAVAVPVTDLPPARVCLAGNAAHGTALVGDFAEVAREAAARRSADRVEIG